MPSNLTDAEWLEILVQLPSVEKPAYDERLGDTEPREIGYNFETVKVSLSKAKYPALELARQRVAEIATLRRFTSPVKAFETVTFWVWEFLK